jgi:hypothetical protein
MALANDKKLKLQVEEPVPKVTYETLRDLLPENTSVVITEEILTLINTMGEDTQLPQDLLQADLLSYVYLLKSTKGTGLKDLINATKYCNLKRHYTNLQAYTITFAEKVHRLQTEGKKIDSYVHMFNKSKLVQAIDREMLIPAHLQYAPYFHAAVKKQFELMNGKAGRDANGKPLFVSPQVMHLAAKELAVITAQPQEAKIDITVGQSDAMLEAQNKMNNHLETIINNQATKFKAGESVEDIQRIHAPDPDEYIEADYDEDE